MYRKTCSTEILELIVADMKKTHISEPKRPAINNPATSNVKTIPLNLVDNWETSKIEDLERTVAELQRRHDSAMHRVNASDGDIVALKKVNDQNFRQIEKLVHTVEDLHKRHTSTMNRVNASDKDLTAFKKVSKQKTREIARLESVLADLTKRLDQVNRLTATIAIQENLKQD